LILYSYVLFFSFLIFLLLLLGADSLHLFSIAVATDKVQRHDNDSDEDSIDADEEDFEKRNSIQICCTWGHSLVDGILAYYIDEENSDKEQQDEVRNAIQEWDRNVDPLELEETSSKENGDILIEFQKEYEGYGNDKKKEEEEQVAGQSINKFDNSGFIDKVRIIIYKGLSDYKFDKDIVEQIVEHEMGHALGLGHANFDGNLMAEKVNDGTEKVSECEVEAVLQANHWKLIADGTDPGRPKINRVMCNEDHNHS
jgi:hypothetical protein